MPLHSSLHDWPRRASGCADVARLDRVLMADPAEFDIVESINSHMSDAGGRLHCVDRARARAQWVALADAYRAAGIVVCILDAPPGLHDFCFAANPALILPLPGGRCECWLSRMAHASRRGEVQYYHSFARAAGLPICEMPDYVTKFEGTGDAILHPGKFLLHAGVGPRSASEAWRALSAAHADLDILTYTLVNENYYHLDTALAPLDERTALYVPEAFDAAGIEMLQAAFPNHFPIPSGEAMRFAGNAHCPDGRHVFLQKGCERTEQWLREHYYIPIPVETGEFIKSGGSVFCLKLAWRANL